MNEGEIRTRVRGALGEAAPPASFASTLRTRLDRPNPPSNPRVYGFVAAVLAVVIVLSLIYVRGNALLRPHPAAGSSPSAAPWIPADVLEAAHLLNVINYITRPNLVGHVGNQTVTFEGAYADEWHMVVIFHVSPDGAIGLGWWDDYGLINYPDEQPHVLFGGWEFFETAGSLGAGSGGALHLQMTVIYNWHIDMAIITHPGQQSSTLWSFDYSVDVLKAVKLPDPHGSFSLGSWTVSIRYFELSPTVIYSLVWIEGDWGRQRRCPCPSFSNVTMTDANGASLPFVTGASDFGASSAYVLINVWTRPTRAGTYNFLIVGQGTQSTTSVYLPAPPTSNWPLATAAPPASSARL